MSIEQTLVEVEPIFRETDSEFTFTHPSFQEVLTAKQFAKEINSKKLSVIDAYVNFWSYEEKADLWNLPKNKEWRALLPDWKPVLLHIASMLVDNKVEELVDIVGMNYSRYEECANRESYNLFEEERKFMLKLTSKNDPLKNKLGSKIVDELFRNKDQSRKYKLLWDLSYLRYFDSSLLNLVVEQDGSGCSAIADVLGEIGHYDPGLMEYLKHKHSGVRYVASEAIIKIGHYDSTLIDLLKHSNNEVKEDAATTIAKVGKEGAVDDLIAYIQDKSNEGREFAAKALGEIRSKKAIPILRKYIQEKENLHREFAVSALGEIGSEEAIGDILNYMKDRTNPGRESAVVALGAIGNKGVIDEIVKYICDKANPDRDQAVLAIGKFGSRNASKKTVSAIVEYMKDEKNPWRVFAASTLGKIGSEEHIEVLCEVGRNGLDRDDTFHAIAKIGGEKAIRTLVDHVTDPNKEYSQRIYAIRGLQTIRSEPVANSLMVAMRNTKNLGRGYAALALGSVVDPNDMYVRVMRANRQDIPHADVGTEKAVKTLIEYIEDKNNPDRHFACEALGKIANFRVIDTLIEYVKDKSNHEMRHAVHALGQIGNEKAVPILIEYLRDKSNYSRSEAAWALGEIGSEEAIDDLINYMDEPEHPYRKVAAQALGKIITEGTIPFVVNSMLKQYDNQNVEIIEELIKSGNITKALKSLQLCDPTNCRAHPVISLIHQRLKPQGYNPPLKRLTA